MNGRDIFTAGGGRGFNLQDCPSELLGGIDVYKTPTADLIEGGIGGVIDLRMRKPLDFDGIELRGSVRGRYETLADKIDPMVSALVSDRRSEERRVGKECVSTFRLRRSPSHITKKYTRHHMSM